MVKEYSIFDVVGPNMIGPSSSHTAGAARLGKMAKKIVGKNIKDVKFYLHGSFAETYKGHGTDKALVGGILGFDTDDVRIRNAFTLATENGVSFEFIKTDLGDVHPNTVKMDITLDNGKEHIVMGSSIGGGNIKITEIDGLKLDFDGSKYAIIMEIKDEVGAVSKIVSILSEDNKSISSINSNKVDNSKFGFVTILVEEKLEDETIEKIRSCNVVEKVVVLDRF